LHVESRLDIVSGLNRLDLTVMAKTAGEK